MATFNASLLYLTAKIQTGQRQSSITDNVNDRFDCFSCQLDLLELFTRKESQCMYAITQQFLNTTDNIILAHNIPWVWIWAVG